jgi:hypothetical protein
MSRQAGTSSGDSRRRRTRTSEAGMAEEWSGRSPDKFDTADTE